MAEPRVAGPRAGEGAAQVPWWLLAALLFLACLAPAVINGLPIVFPDTQGYLPVARSLRPSHLRAFGYGAFLRATGVFWSLWLPILAQAAIACWLALRLLALEAPRWPAPRRAAIATGLVLLLCIGHLPWLAAWLMPDLFTGLLALGLLLGALHWPRLPGWERALLAVFLVGTGTLHLTHPPLLLGFAAAAGALALLLRRHGAPEGMRAAARGAGLALAASLLAYALLIGSNLVTYRQATASTGGPVFLFARLQADTRAAEILRPHCAAGEDFAICPHLDRLGMTADTFLWRDDRSPLPALGYMSGFWPEAKRLNPILLREGWADWLGASARRTLGQLVDVELGDGMDAEGPEMLSRDLRGAAFDMPAIAEAVTRTRQAEDGLRPLMPRAVAEPVALLAVVVLLALAVLGLRAGRASVWVPAVLFLAFYLGHAALIALAGEVHGRYGARIVFAAPLLAGLLWLRRAYPLPGGASTLSR